MHSTGVDDLDYLFLKLAEPQKNFSLQSERCVLISFRFPSHPDATAVTQNTHHSAIIPTSELAD